jgi:hypothetical protein
VAQVHSQLMLRMLRKHYPNSPGLITTMAEPQSPAGMTALEHQRGAPGEHTQHACATHMWCSQHCFGSCQWRLSASSSACCQCCLHWFVA